MTLLDTPVADVLSMPFEDLLSLVHADPGFPAFPKGAEIAEKTFRDAVVAYIKEKKGVSYETDPAAAAAIRKDAMSKETKGKAVAQKAAEIVDPLAKLKQMGFSSKDECTRTLAVIERDRLELTAEKEAMKEKHAELDERLIQVEARENYCQKKAEELNVTLKAIQEETAKLPLPTPLS